MISLLAQAEAREERLRLALESVLGYAEVMAEEPDMNLSSVAVGRDLQDIIWEQLQPPAESTPAV